MEVRESFMNNVEYKNITEILFQLTPDIQIILMKWVSSEKSLRYS